MGQGLLRLWGFKVYQAAYYADARGHRALLLQYHRAIPARRFVEAGDKFLRRNLDEASLSRLQPDIDRLHAAYRDVQPGDTYTLVVDPAAGTTLLLNAVPLLTIPNPDFGDAYLRIWFGDQPVSPSLKRQLLGQTQ